MIQASLLALLAAAVAAAPIVSQHAILEAVEAAQSATRSGDETSARARSGDIQELIGRRTGVLAPDVGNHPIWRASGSCEAVPDLVSALESEQYRVKDAPTAEIRHVIAELRAMRQMEYRSFDVTGKALKDREMGRYTWVRGREHEGAIALNHALRRICWQLPVALVALTAVHEIGHKLDTDPNKSELYAFALQYRVLKWLDKTGYLVADMRVDLLKLERRAPPELRPVIRQALEYATTLDVLAGTGGDDQKLRQFIKDLGYEGEGLDHTSA